MDARALTRREVLALLAALCSNVPPAMALGRATASRETSELAANDGPLLRRIFRARADAATIGAVYLKRAPEERSEALLRRLLDLPVVPDNGLDPSEIDALASVLFARNRNDFREGHVFRINGWTLSLTELRLCALVYLHGMVSR